MEKYNIEQLIRDNACTIVDVRTPAEFMGGHVADSINMPLDELPEQIEKLRARPAPLVLCCASGNRSGQAHRFLSQYGIECVNGGSWLDVNYLKNQFA